MLRRGDLASRVESPSLSRAAVLRARGHADGGPASQCVCHPGPRAAAGNVGRDNGGVDFDEILTSGRIVASLADEVLAADSDNRPSIAL